MKKPRTDKPDGAMMQLHHPGLTAKNGSFAILAIQPLKVSDRKVRRMMVDGIAIGFLSPQALRKIIYEMASAAHSQADEVDTILAGVDKAMTELRNINY